MKREPKKEVRDCTNLCIALQEFCDMEQLYTLLDNWSKSTGMSAVIVDADGAPTSESFGMTEFCSMEENGKEEYMTGLAHIMQVDFTDG